MGECLIIKSDSGIDTSTATASSDMIVDGYTCYVNDELVVGAIPVNTIGGKLLPGNIKSIKYGYYDNTNLISTSALKEETISTAVSSDILTDNTGWSNGSNIIGNIVNRGALSQSLGVNSSYAIPQGWHSGTGKVTQALAVQGTVGITPTSWNQTVCDAGRWTSGDQWVWGNGNLVPWNIKNGVEIFGVWGNFTGWVDPTLQLNGLIPVITYTENEAYGGWSNCVVTVTYGGNSPDSTLLAKIINTGGYTGISMKFTAFTPGNDRWCWEIDGSVVYWELGNTSFSGSTIAKLHETIYESRTATWSFSYNYLSELPTFSRFGIWASLYWYKGNYGANMYDWSAWLNK